MFKAIVMNQTEDSQPVLSIEHLEDSFLSAEGEVIVRVYYAGLNYKDGLCLNGQGGLIREFPRIPGVEFAGEVLESQDERYAAGDQVIATGSRIGEVWHGGYAEKASVKADWLVPLPTGIDMRQSMIFGTAGITAIYGLQALERHGLTPEKGEVLVTGAAGGVGSFAIALLAALGYSVAAVTGRVDVSGEYLRSLGANTLVPRQQLAEAIKRPLESERWAGCIDNVGGEMLARIIGQLKYGCSAAAIGNAGGHQVPASVIPFLLRGVNLLGIDSVNQPYDSRVQAWSRLVEDFPLDKLDSIATELSLDDLETASKDILSGKIQGRCVVCL
jgi:acrylyl-CoA reductase (NADPH)